MNLRLDIKILKLWPKLVDHYKEILTEFIGKMCNRFKPIIFHDGSLFNHESKLILCPNGQLNENVEI